MRHFKKALSLVLALAMLLGCVTVTAFAEDDCPSKGFSDVPPEGHWAHEGIDFMVKNEYMNGVGGDKFSPDGIVTRAQLVTIICRLSGDEIKGLGQDLAFSDTKKNAWYSDYLGWAVRDGVIAGYPDNTFRPNSPVTRAELAVVFARYFAGREIYLADAPLTDSFTDGSKIAKWARDAVETIRLCGIIAGDKAGNFNPSSSATRAEIAMMITRYLSAQKLSKSDWIMAHPDYAEMLVRSMASPDYVRSRLSFGWRTFGLRMTKSSNIRDELEGLGNSVFADVAKQAASAQQEVFSGRDSVTQKALPSRT